jgi:predicted choloylglycine hydrolase
VEEAVKTLLNTSFATTNNYLLADKDGRMGVVEASPGKVRVRGPEVDHRYIVATNHFIHPEMLDMEDKAQRDQTSTSRYSAISEALGRQHGRIDAEAAQSILSSHEGFVCSHMDNIELGTLWSLTATLRQPRLYRAEGNPCKTEYEIDERLTWVITGRSGP